MYVQTTHKHNASGHGSPAHRHKDKSIQTSNRLIAPHRLFFLSTTDFCYLSHMLHVSVMLNSLSLLTTANYKIFFQYFKPKGPAFCTFFIWTSGTGLRFLMFSVLMFFFSFSLKQYYQ